MVKEIKMAQVNSAQSYGNPIKKNGAEVSSGAGTKQAAQPAGEGNGILPEDAVSLRPGEIPAQRAPQLSLKSFKQSLGQDISFVKETIRNKVAEYGLPAQTRLNVSKDAFGKIAVGGHVQEQTLQRIQSDLNNNHAFKRSFDRVSVQEPTLNYLDTANKLTKTYGVSNNIVNAIISDKAEFNSLNDIAHRYARYGETVVGNFAEISAGAEMSPQAPSAFRFTA
jgi:hypothetical protein